jgi:hypothetical protein
MLTVLPDSDTMLNKPAEVMGAEITAKQKQSVAHDKGACVCVSHYERE